MNESMTGRPRGQISNLFDQALIRAGQQRSFPRQYSVEGIVSCRAEGVASRLPGTTLRGAETPRFALRDTGPVVCMTRVDGRCSQDNSGAERRSQFRLAGRSIPASLKAWERTR